MVVSASYDITLWGYLSLITGLTRQLPHTKVGDGLFMHLEEGPKA
jgi:hypothetical protein